MFVKKFSLLIILLFTVFQARAQEELRKRNLFWISGGLGVFQGTHKANGVSLVTDINLIHEGSHLKLAGSYHTELFSFSSKPSEKYSELGLLWGRAFSSKLVRLSATAGLSIITGKAAEFNMDYYNQWGPKGRWEERKFTSLGIPLRIESSLILIKEFGISIGGFGNLNMNRSYWGITANLSLGRLR